MIDSELDFAVTATLDGLVHSKPSAGLRQRRSTTSLSGPSSSYWRVPDDRQFLTAIALRSADSICAVASGSDENNLFIYELNPEGKTLTHHQTISLPQVHALEWAPHPLSSQGNIIVSGHKNGYVNLTLLPDSYSTSMPAEILKHYNHQRHVSSKSSQTSTRIKQLQLTTMEWSCCPPASILSLCSDHIFMWDVSRSDAPLVKQKAKGVSCFDASGRRDGVVALGGRKGLSIRDMRIRGVGGLSPPSQSGTFVSHVKWSPNNENMVAAVHDSTTVRVWDVRMSEPLSTYRGHTDMITGLEWSPHQANELVSASKEGTIRVWDPSVTDDDESFKPYKRRSNWDLYEERMSHDAELDRLALEILDDSAQNHPKVRHNKQFVGLRVGDCGAVSIDQEGFLGYHRLHSEFAGCASPTSESSESDFMPPFDFSLE